MLFLLTTFSVFYYLNKVRKIIHQWFKTIYSSLLIFFYYSQTPDHPKLYLWSEQGLNSDEEPIQDKLEECKLTRYYFYIHIFKFILTCF